jgi:hypothetical protein
MTEHVVPVFEVHQGMQEAAVPQVDLRRLAKAS